MINKIKNNIRKLLSGFLGAALLLSSTSVYAKSGDWGLGYPTPGAKPAGNEEAEYLKQFDAYYVGEGEEKVIYLTFDAGYENGCTEEILDALKKHEAPAAFFLVGTYIKNNPEIIKRMVSEGHIVGNHTMTHQDMSKVTDIGVFTEELTKTEDEYRNVTGEEMPKFYRPPQGRYSVPNLQAAKDLGYKTIFWSLAYMDFNDKAQPDKETAFSKLIPRIHPGAIILLHSTSKTNAQILDELIGKYKEMGYSFRCLEDLEDL